MASGGMKRRMAAPICTWAWGIFRCRRTTPSISVASRNFSLVKMAAGAIGTSGQALPGPINGTPFFVKTGNLAVNNFNVLGTELLWVNVIILRPGRRDDQLRASAGGLEWFVAGNENAQVGSSDLANIAPTTVKRGHRSCHSAREFLPSEHAGWHLYRSRAWSLRPRLHARSGRCERLRGVYHGFDRRIELVLESLHETRVQLHPFAGQRSDIRSKYDRNLRHARRRSISERLRVEG